jgi:hypothetical protein
LDEVTWNVCKRQTRSRRLQIAALPIVHLLKIHMAIVVYQLSTCGDHALLPFFFVCESHWRNAIVDAHLIKKPRTSACR